MFNNHNQVVIKYLDQVVLEFKDYPENGSPVNFSRKVKNTEYVFRDGVPVITMETKKFNSIVPQLGAKSMFTNILTFDIETRTLDGVMTPYCICYHDGKRTGYYWLTKFASVDAMVEAFIRLLLDKNQYNNHIVYAHNFSKFDGIFILKPLIKVCSELKYKVDIIKKESDIINIKITGHGFNLTLRDSLLLLPAPLRDLSRSFGLPLDQQKGIFPYAFVNLPDISLDYKGPVPEFKYFSNITLDQYNEYLNKRNNKWNLRLEAINYCQLDCISLYQILIKFSESIFNDLKVSLKYAPTISSLALRTFRTKFLDLNKSIPVITGDAFDFIKKSYTGGHVDVYNPHGFNVHHYDVNSLYPFVMKNYPMPVGDLTFFEGDILQLKDRPFGFFEVECVAPEGLHIPVLQSRLVTPDGVKTLAPLGKWSGVYSSAEIYNAIDNFGYNIKVLRGYLFKETAIIYDRYVNYFSNIKANTPKNDPMYLISKLLMNSLYGKTGQDYKFESTLILNHEELLKLIQNPKVEVSSITELDKDLTLVTCLKKSKYEIKPDNVIRSFNGSIAHASSITAYARIEMHKTIKLLTELGIKIYYMDTDSLFTDKPLPVELVNPTLLGKFKLENIYKEAIFLAPKVYGGITLDGNEIIKVKGLKYNKDLTFDNFKSLLIKDTSLTLEQNKLFTRLGDNSINLIKQSYSLIPTENRRELIYTNNKLSGTKPFVVNNQ
jgi:DNA polymerase elongation subunit (family B)